MDPIRLPAAAAGAGAPLAGKGELPQNVEIEQSLLGALLLQNDIFSRIEGIVAAEHFFDPLHARIFDLIADRVRAGALASPVTLKVFLDGDPAMEAVGGVGYLARLAGSATSLFAAPQYAAIIRDLALRRQLIALAEDIADRAGRMDSPETGAQEQIVTAEQSLYQLGEHGRVDRGFRSLRAAVVESIEVAGAAWKRGTGLAGMPTGMVDLDRMLGGLHRSDLVILAGRPSMGKTALATNIAFHVASRAGTPGADPAKGKDSPDGGSVGFFSLEMSREQLATRILSDLARAPSHRIRQGRIDKLEFRTLVEAANRVESAPLWIDDTPALPISQIASRARRLKRTKGLDLVVVDYLQLVRPTSSRESRVTEVSEITQGLKALAKELDIPVLALSQLSRQVENRDDKRPLLSDLRESGSIEQDADVVMFVFREEYYAERTEPPIDELARHADWEARMERIRGVAEVIVGKQRHGPIGTVELSFEGQYTRFGNLARDRDRSDLDGPGGAGRPERRDAPRSPRAEPDHGLFDGDDDTMPI